MKYGLNEDTIERIVRVIKNHPQVERVIIYGSRAKGNYKPSSDIDLTLVGEQVTLEIMNKISWQLDDLLLPYTIDLSIFHHIHQSDLLDHIKRVGSSFYEKQ